MKKIIIEWDKSGTIEYHKSWKDRKEAESAGKKCADFFDLNKALLKKINSEQK